MARERLAADRSRRAARPAEKTAGPSRSLPIEKIARLYPDEWIAVKVTALDEGGDISAGHVLAHSCLREDVSGALLEAPRSAQNAWPRRPPWPTIT